MKRTEEADASDDHVWAVQESMVETQLARRGIANQRVLEAFRRVPREAFVPGDLAPHALEDGPLPIGLGQTISQPYIVALMTELLAPQTHDRVLEVGTGSGYSAAILAELSDDVVSVERHAPLCEAARSRLARLGYGQVRVHCADGTLGWPAGAPYDAISVTAATAQVPDALLEQLAPGGRLVAPVGPAHAQVLTRYVRRADGSVLREPGLQVQFVPLVRESGDGAAASAGES